MIWKPELFAGDMVRAILEGRKTQTRRIMKPQPGPMVFGSGTWYPSAPPEDHHGRGKYYHYANREMFLANVAKDFCPHPVGSGIWVREACWLWGRWTRNGLTSTGRQKWRFREVAKDTPGFQVRYDKPETTAKRNGSIGWVYRHARYMPRWAARLFLKVVEVRVQRVQDISEEDAEAEGVDALCIMPEYKECGWSWEQAGMCTPGRCANASFIRAFAMLWDSLYATRPGCSFEANPYVRAYTFRMVES